LPSIIGQRKTFDDDESKSGWDKEAKFHLLRKYFFNVVPFSDANADDENEGWHWHKERERAGQSKKDNELLRYGDGSLMFSSLVA
jgi:hypothetical protein